MVYSFPTNSTTRLRLEVRQKPRLSPTELPLLYWLYSNIIVQSLNSSPPQYTFHIQIWPRQFQLLISFLSPPLVRLFFSQLSLQACRTMWIVVSALMSSLVAWNTSPTIPLINNAFTADSDISNIFCVFFRNCAHFFHDSTFLNCLCCSF